jgi:hypothetical protein
MEIKELVERKLFELLNTGRVGVFRGTKRNTQTVDSIQKDLHISIRGNSGQVQIKNRRYLLSLHPTQNKVLLHESGNGVVDYRHINSFLE